VLSGGIWARREECAPKAMRIAVIARVLGILIREMKPVICHLLPA
jgi:hypothetical protein